MSYPDHKVRLLVNSALEIAPHDQNCGKVRKAGYYHERLRTGPDSENRSLPADRIGGLNPKRRIAIFVTVEILGYTTGRELVSQFIPGSRHFVAPLVLVATIVAVLFGVSAYLLRDYRTDHLITGGVTCLTTGLICAAPAGLISAWILRRGFAVNPVSAGLALGILSGIAGVAMLELHCANFQPLHLLWHLLVVLVAGIVGALVGQWVFGRG
jgi:hypothetical protein